MPLHVIIVMVTLVYKHPGTLINQLTEFLESIESSVVWTRHVYINHHSCFLFITFWYQIFLSIFVVWHSDKPIYLEHDMQHKDKAYSTLHIARKMKAKGIFLKEAGLLKKMKMDNVGFQSSLLIYIISNTYHLIELIEYKNANLNLPDKIMNIRLKYLI